MKQSIRARLAKTLLRAGRSHQPRTNLVASRRIFERRLKLLTPTTGARHMRPAAIPGVAAYWVAPPGVATKRTIVYFHGGGFVNGSTRAYLQHLIRTAKVCNARVLSVDYKLAPEHPYPAALDDIVAVWRFLLQDKNFSPKHAVFMGVSAGGSLAVAGALRVRDATLPLPGAVVSLSAALDMSLSGESLSSRAGRELILTRQKIAFYADMYAGKASRTGPYISPVLANLQGLPPLLIHVGSEEMLYSDSIRLAEHAKRDNVPCELYVGEGMWHGWHVMANIVPEAKRDMQAVATFIKQKTPLTR